MPINASYEYYAAEKKYLAAQTLEEKISTLRGLISASPTHKGSENLLAELRLRLKKFKEKLEKGKKVGGGKKGIRKDGFQVALIGLTNSGKSYLLTKLTNATSKISLNKFTTSSPVIGTMNFEGVKAQIVDLPPSGSKDFDYGVVNNADCLLMIIENIEDLKDISKNLKKAVGKKIIVLNKIDLLDKKGLRKTEATLKSKRLNYVMVSAKDNLAISDLKKKIFEEMKVIRVFTKEPGKKKAEDPVVLSKGSTVRDAAEEIYKGFSKQVKETRLTGPSGKFSNQRVGLTHKLKHMDVLEFKA